MKYGPQTTKDICKYLSAGNNIQDSCALAGIHKDTFYEWLKDPSKTDFSDSIKKAELQCKARNIAIIQNAGPKTWQAAAWWLERRYKDEFSLRSEITGRDGEPLVTKLKIIRTDGSESANRDRAGDSVS